MPDPAATRSRMIKVTPEEERRVDDALQQRVGMPIDTLTPLFLLESVKGFGPQKFKELYDAGATPDEVLNDPAKLPMRGKRADAFRKAIAAFDEYDGSVARARAVRQLVRADEHTTRILAYDHPAYPRQVFDSNNPVPVLYVRGDATLLGRPGVACVGSREIRPPYSELHAAFAAHAAKQGLTVVSGFALGADTVGHRAAVKAGGRTTLVMPCGLDRPFPPENKELWAELLDYGGAVAVSEFPFGTAASALTLRKRNKLIVSFALGVLVSQSSAKGGAMNAYRFGKEQKKPVATFEPDGTDQTSGNAQIASTDVQHRVGAAAGEAFSLHGRQAEWSEWLSKLSSWT